MTKESLKASLVKIAQVRVRSNGAAPYKGYGPLAIQQFAPISKRRQFSPSELDEVDRGENKLIPKIWQSYQTPMWQLLASPGKTGLISALPGLVAGGGIGGLIGAGFKNPYGSMAGAITGAGMGAAATGFLGYYARKQRNENIKELMRRLPPHATKRDMLSDPAYQADLERKHQTELAVMQMQSMGNRGAA